VQQIQNAKASAEKSRDFTQNQGESCQNAKKSGCAKWFFEYINLVIGASYGKFKWREKCLVEPYLA
jgi:hypothetical protein